MKRLQQAGPTAVLTVLLTTLLVIAACGGSDGAGDTARAADTGMVGMAHGADSGMARGPARDADHEFLRMMSDHHQGLIEMATAAMTKASAEQTKGEAHELHTKQEREQKEMLDMIRTAYGETLQPMVMPSNRAMSDTLQRTTGADYDRTFYRMVVRHHREGIEMMDDYQSRVQRAEVRQMIDRMRADQQREIQRFEPKANQRA